MIGFAAAGSALSYSLANSVGSGSGDSFKVGIYGSTRRGNAYLSASAAYGYYDLTTDRTVLLPGMLDHLKGKFIGNSFGGRVEAGYRFPVTASAGITPYAALQAQVFQQPNYTETDLTGLAAFRAELRLAQLRRRTQRTRPALRLARSDQRQFDAAVAGPACLGA